MTPVVRASRPALWTAVILALVLITWGRISLLDNLRDQGYFAKYVVFADQILAGKPPAHRIGDVSPAYLWFVVAMRAIGLGFEGIRNVQVILTTFAAFLCALASRRFGGWVAGAVAIVLLLGNRAALIVGAEIEPEALILLLNAGAVLAVVRKKWWAAGLLIGLSAAARPVAMLTLILIAGWALLQSWRAAVSVIAAAVAPILAVMLLNASLSGHMLIMQPGSQLYEANNPLATGCAGVIPRIVTDLQNASTEPDYLHVAYRIVAARATGAPIDAKLSNRYWSRKAIAYMTSYPIAALQLSAWKALLIVHHYDVYDLVTMKRKSLELAYPSIPFGLAFVLSIIAFILRRDRRELLPVALFALAGFVTMIVFNVSARQRNTLLAPLTVLGGAGAAAIVSLARERNERSLFAFAAVIIATPLLGIEGAPMREDAYAWWTRIQADGIRAEAYRAREEGQRERAIELAAAASILDIGERPLVSKPALARAALAIAARTESPQRLFDIAVALQKAGAWRESEAVLASIEDYRPERENRAVSSVAYYRARAAVHQRAPLPSVRALLDRAEREAPGDQHVLALRFLLGDANAGRELDAFYDPFTRDHALAGAFADLGDLAKANALIANIRRRIPEWTRPAPFSPAPEGMPSARITGRSGVERR